MVGVEEEEGWGGSLDQFAVESAVSLTSRGDLLFLLWCRGSRRAKKKERKEKRRQQTLRSTNSGLSWPFREQILTFIGMPAFCLLSMHMNFFHPHPWTVRNGFMERGLESVIQCYSAITSNQLPSIIFKHLFTPSWVCACLIPTKTTLMHLDL